MDLEQQRIWFFDVEGYDIFALDLDVFRLLQTAHCGVECARGAQFEGAIPCPAYILRSELIAPVALDALAELEDGALAARIQLPAFSKLADHVDAAGLVSVEGDVLASGRRNFLIGDLLEAQQAVIQGCDRFESPKADIEIAVKALRGGRRRHDKRGPGLRHRAGDLKNARHHGRGCHRGCRLQNIASVEIDKWQAREVRH